MTPNGRLIAVLLGALLCLAGCSGHYTFSDDEYRPLGDPASIHRGK
ncbi:type VI secretion protein [Pseudomonas sp. v388]|nr:type VI secretion protein [Pseudomonas sp. v388]RRV05325.1 type VI secretion protein [Pseudomonas sp. v388]